MPGEVLSLKAFPTLRRYSCLQINVSSGPKREVQVRQVWRRSQGRGEVVNAILAGDSARASEQMRVHIRSPLRFVDAIEARYPGYFGGD